MRYQSFLKHSLFLSLAFCALMLTATAAAFAQIVKLNPTLQSGEALVDFQVSPSGAYTVYRVQDADYNINLYSVPTAGGIAKKLNQTFAASGGQVDVYQISPNGSRVVFRADTDNDYSYDLFSAAITGGAVVKLNPAFAAGCGEDCSVSDEFKVAPNSSRVAYKSEQTAGVELLYSVPINGGASVNLSRTLPAPGEVYGDFDFTPDSSRAVFFYGATSQTRKFYSVPSAGGTAALLTNVTSRSNFEYKITPDSRRVVFTDDRNADSQKELYSVSTTGGNSLPLSLTGEAVENFALAGRFNAVVYSFNLADGTTSFTGVLTNDASRRAGVNAGNRVVDFAISPDNLKLVFTASRSGQYITDLYSITANNNGDVVLLSSGNLPQYSYGVSRFKILPNSQRVIFSSFQDNAYLEGLYSVPINGGANSRLDNPPSPDASFAGVGDFQPTPNSRRVAFTYSATDSNGLGYDLFVNSAAGGTAPTLISNNVGEFKVTGDSRRVVFTRTSVDENYNYTTDLLSASVGS